MTSSYLDAKLDSALGYTLADRLHTFGYQEVTPSDCIGIARRVASRIARWYPETTRIDIMRHVVAVIDNA